MDLTRLHSVEGGLLEGPRYDDDGSLYFADARHGGVFRLDAGGDVELVIPHRRGIGGLALHEDGGCVVTGRNVAYKPLSQGGAASPTQVLIEQDKAVDRVGFNDLTVDAKGRIYVGSLAIVAIHADLSDPTLPAGSLFLIDTDGSYREVANDIRITNGMALSPDGRRLYLSDTGRRVVFSFDVDPGTGDLSNQRILIRIGEGIPDGMAVDVGGDIWLAHAFAGKIVRYAADGTAVETHELPDPMVTSLCFGGPDLKTLYIVTGVEGPDATGLAHVYSADAGVAGTPVAKARTKITLRAESI